MPGRRTILAVIAAGLAGIAGIYGAAATLGFSLDRPAWRSELMLVAEALQHLQLDVDARELRRLRAREDDLVLRIEKARAAGQPPDAILQLQLRQVRRQISDLEKEVKPP